jgi:hypothetical protein
MLRLILLTTAGLLGVEGCGLPGEAPPPTIDVSVAFWGDVLEVGSVSRACAFGLAPSGYYVATRRVDQWTLSDPTLATLLPMPDARDNYSCRLVRVNRPGQLTVTATMAGLEGTNTVRLIPAISQVVVQPSSATLHVGDTTSVTITIIAVNGDTLRDLPIEWRATDYSAVNVVHFGPATAIQALRAGASVVTFEASTSRLDSITNVRGSTQVTVLP